MIKFKYFLIIMGLIITLPAFAYIGPGAGISFLGSLFSTLLVVLLTIGSILFWPLRYMWKRIRRLSKESKNNSSLETEEKEQNPDQFNKDNQE